MAFEDSSFATIPLGTRERVRCSPRMPAGFVGIRIRCYGEVPVSAGRMPLCGAYLLPTMDIPAGVEVVDSMVVHVRRIEDDHVSSRLVGPPVEAMPIEAVPSPVVPSPDTLVGGYFNVDLLALFGTRAGEYRVHVELGGHRSKERVVHRISGTTG